MSDELSFNGAEFAKPVENKGKYRKKRFMFLGLYVVFAALYLYLFLVPVKMPALIAILPLFIYILYLATWRYCNFEWLIRVNVGKIIPSWRRASSRRFPTRRGTSRISLKAQRCLISAPRPMKRRLTSSFTARVRAELWFVYPFAAPLLLRLADTTTRLLWIRIFS